MKSIPGCLLPIVTLIATASIGSAAVMVGNSTLIGTLDYSDTFTGGTATARPIENAYGNPTQTWGNIGSLASDSNIVNGSPSYPGTSGAGSATGITQKGSLSTNIIGYGLRNDFVAQFDAVQANAGDGITLGIGSGNNMIILTYTVSAANGLTTYTLYNPVVGNKGVTTGLNTSTGLAAGTWNNYAIEFNLTAKLMKVYINQTLEGTIDLNTFDGGSFAANINASSNAFINLGGALAGGGSNRLWTDNYQVGAPVPEPSTLALAAVAFIGLVGFKRRRFGTIS